MFLHTRPSASLKLCWKWFMPGNHWTEKPPHFEGDIFGMQGFVGFPCVSLAFLGMRQWLTNQRRFGIWATHRIWIFLISRDFIYYLFGWSWWILIGCCRIPYIAFPWIPMKYCTHASQPIATSPFFHDFLRLNQTFDECEVHAKNLTWISGSIPGCLWCMPLPSVEVQSSDGDIESDKCRHGGLKLASADQYIFLEDVSYW